MREYERAKDPPITRTLKTTGGSFTPHGPSRLPVQDDAFAPVDVRRESERGKVAVVADAVPVDEDLRHRMAPPGTLAHPRTGKQVTWRSPLPRDMKRLVDSLRKQA